MGKHRDTARRCARRSGGENQRGRRGERRVSMRVTEVKTFLVHPGGGKHWLFVKVETDAGIHGWGECYTQSDRDQVIALQAEQIGRYLIGRDPFAIKHFTTAMYLDWAGKRGSMEFYCALSG